MDDAPFHPGERRAQLRAFGAPSPGGVGIRSFMPDQHRLFFGQLPFLAVGTLDETGAPAATLLTGEPGFVRSPDPRTLVIAAHADDPTGRRLVEGAPVGLLGIELPTRRRNRANGRITDADPGGITVSVDQSFGNCPQYIHVRDVAAEPVPPGRTETFDGLDAAARAQILTADTFFVATSSGGGVDHGGCDISHRGGPGGFVRIDGDVLTIPDYRGNRFFNTLGNLLLEPRAALLFVDFAAGRMLHLQGIAEVLWDDDGLPGAERAWRFRVERGWRGPAGVRTV